MLIRTERPLSPGTGQRSQENNQYVQNTLSNINGQGRINVKNAAIQLLSLGYSVIPTNVDKTPAIPSWKQYQKQAMCADTARQVFCNECSLAIVAGTVSGNLECLDFDKPELYRPFLDTLEDIDQELAASLVKRQTPSGGFHLIYRCNGLVTGNQKLAMSVDGKDTWIETRGEGGYFLTTPSPGYDLLEHSLKNTPVISLEEKERLHSLAQSFSEKQEPPRHKKTITATWERPGDDFNNKTDESLWRNLLESEGWNFTGRVTSGGEHLTRPGKSKGTSATLKNGCLYVFSSNAGLPLGPHNAFSLYAHLKHQGNFTEAAKELVSQGYGSNRLKTVDDKEWPEPTPLPEALPPVAAYDFALLPETLRPWAEDICDRI